MKKINHRSNPPSRANGRPKGTSSQTPTVRFAYEWSDELPVEARAMVLAGQTLFVAGPPDVVNEEEAVKSLDNPNLRAKLAEQGAAYKGHGPAILTAVSATDGKGLVSYQLAAAPVFDGMAAAGGKLYLSTVDGKVLCLGSGPGTPLARAADVIVTPRPDADKPLTTAPAQPSAVKRRARS